MLRDGASEHWPVARHEVDEAVRESRLLEDLVDGVVGQDGGVARLPHHAVAHDGGRVRQVAGDGREVEGRDGGDEALQRAVAHQVQRRRRILAATTTIRHNNNNK